MVRIPGWDKIWASTTYRHSIEQAAPRGQRELTFFLPGESILKEQVHWDFSQIGFLSWVCEKKNLFMQKKRTSQRNPVKLSEN